MSTYPILTLKAGREISLKNRHPAVYVTAVEHAPEVQNGGIVEVQSSTGEFLCYATYNRRAYICLRAIGFAKRDPLEQIREAIERAIALRTMLAEKEDTTAWRLVNAEGDGIPGLIVDRYGDVLTVQFTTLGMDRLREWVTETLIALLKPKAIFEKSTGSARKKEGLENVEHWIRGGVEGGIEVRERGVRYKIELHGSQKTGLFLDQREMRSMVREFAKDRTVLDICSYVGGFSVNALLGGAIAADAVDYDALALQRATEHATMNGIDAGNLGTYAEDAFVFLRREPMPHTYDFIILDPPAFAKRSADLDPAKKAYTDLNRLALQRIAPGGLLLTCSCSYQMQPDIFQTAVFHAARQAGRNVRILQRHRQAMDHPVSLYHPESDYLKSLLLAVE
jgi:23S rRNA (cytosine1962-C5)-methyltransferase